MILSDHKSLTHQICTRLNQHNKYIHVQIHATSDGSATDEANEANETKEPMQTSAPNAANETNETSRGQ